MASVRKLGQPDMLGLCFLLSSSGCLLLVLGEDMFNNLRWVIFIFFYGAFGGVVNEAFDGACLLV